MLDFFSRKALYLMIKTMVSCRFILKPIQWYPHFYLEFPEAATSAEATAPCRLEIAWALTSSSMIERPGPTEMGMKVLKLRNWRVWDFFIWLYLVSFWTWLAWWSSWQLIFDPWPVQWAFPAPTCRARTAPRMCRRLVGLAASSSWNVEGPRKPILYFYRNRCVQKHCTWDEVYNHAALCLHSLVF